MIKEIDIVAIAGTIIFGLFVAVHSIHTMRANRDIVKKWRKMQEENEQ